MLKTLFVSSSLAALLAQTPPPSPQPYPTPTPMPTVTATPTAGPLATPMPIPTGTPLPSPSASPSSTPSPTPSPTPAPSNTPLPPIPTPLPTPLILPPDAPPQILAVQLSDPVFRGGQTVSGTVITSTNVAAVELRMAGHTIRMPRADFGIWQMSYQMPHVPFWMRKNYTAQVVAINTAGTETSRDVTISVR